MIQSVRDPQTVTPEGELLAPLPEGVTFHEVTTHVDDRGTVCELYDERWDWHPDPLVFAYTFTIRPGKVKGWGMHKRHEDRYLLLHGEMLCVFYDERDDSSTSGLVATVVAVASQPPADEHPHRCLARDQEHRRYRPHVRELPDAARTSTPTRTSTGCPSTRTRFPTPGRISRAGSRAADKRRAIGVRGGRDHARRLSAAGLPGLDRARRGGRAVRGGAGAERRRRRRGGGGSDGGRRSPRRVSLEPGLRRRVERRTGAGARRADRAACTTTPRRRRDGCRRLWTQPSDIRTPA